MTAAISEYTVRTLNVKRQYTMGNEIVHALKGVSISIARAPGAASREAASARTASRITSPAGS